MDGVARKSMEEIANVYVWDMDETLILLKSLLNGAYAEAFGGAKDVKKGIELGKMWENLILQLCDELFFYEQIENYNKPFLDALCQYDDRMDLSHYDFYSDGFGTPHDDANMRKLAYRHRSIASRYTQGLHNFLNEEMMNHWNELYDLTDEYTDRWLSSARAFLEQYSSEKDQLDIESASGTSISGTNLMHINVLVSSGGLVASLVKCLLFRLDKFITHGNVYCSWEVGKTQCFQWIKERFNGPNVQFCVIGDGWEECEAAYVMRWPFVKISPPPGSGHRFPGLTLKTLGYYSAVVYGNPSTENDDSNSSSGTIYIWRSLKF